MFMFMMIDRWMEASHNNGLECGCHYAITKQLWCTSASMNRRPSSRVGWGSSRVGTKIGASVRFSADTYRTHIVRRHTVHGFDEKHHT